MSKPTKEAAMYAFWNSYSIPAYEENTVPDEAELPYITYQLITDSRFSELPLAANIYYRSDSWVEINAKANEISYDIQTGKRLECEGGWLWIKKGSPFVQNMSDSTDDTIRRKYINITVEFCTQY